MHSTDKQEYHMCILYAYPQLAYYKYEYEVHITPILMKYTLSTDIFKVHPQERALFYLGVI